MYHVAFHPAFEERLPYTVAVVELEEGPRMITNLIDSDAGEPQPDRAVALQVEQDAGLYLARFRVI